MVGKLGLGCSLTEILVKLGLVTAEILLIWTNVARTNVAWTNVHLTIVLDWEE